MTFDINENNGKVVLSGLKNFNIESILECGQCFRWERNARNDYSGIVKNRTVRIVQEGDLVKFIGCTLQDYYDLWQQYFDMETDYGSIIRTLSEDDEVMRKATGFAPGIRILKQPLFETLISFIISANNSIPNIKRVISSLSSMYGKRIVFDNKEFFTFPEPEVLAKADLQEIKSSKAGYRSLYIKKTADAFARKPFSTGDLSEMGYQEAKKFLMGYVGVGAKVADCTLLFSGAFTCAFPVDVWVKKIMDELYMDKSASLDKINDFAVKRFKNLGGYAQQYLFFYARSNM